MEPQHAEHLKCHLIILWAFLDKINKKMLQGSKKKIATGGKQSYSIINSNYAWNFINVKWLRGFIEQYILRGGK